MNPLSTFTAKYIIIEFILFYIKYLCSIIVYFFFNFIFLMSCLVSKLSVGGEKSKFMSHEQMSYGIFYELIIF